MTIRAIFALSFLILAMAISYFLVVHLPQSSQAAERQTALENSKVCQEAAMRLHDQDGSNIASGQSQMEPRYEYFQEENLCVYRGGFISSESVHEYIKNAMTNETLFEYITRANGVVIYGDKQAFEVAKRVYFSAE